MEREPLTKGLMPCLRLALFVERQICSFKARPARAKNVRFAGAHIVCGRHRVERTEGRMDAVLRIQSSVFGR